MKLYHTLPAYMHNHSMCSAQNTKYVHNGYLDTWSGFEAAKTAPWPSRGLHHFGKFLEPSDEWAGRGCCCSWCGDIVGNVWLIRNELQKFVELKFEFLNFNTFDVFQIFWQRVAQPRPKYSYCIFLKGLCWVSVCWILNKALCSMTWMFSGFYFVSHFTIYIWHNMLWYFSNIYTYNFHGDTWESIIWVRAIFPSTLSDGLKLFCM